MNRDGSGIEQLTDTPDDAQRPVWSTDGLQIAYVDLEATDDAVIVIMEADSPWDEQEPTQLPPLGDGRFDLNSWSPDGQWWAGNGYAGAPPGIYVYSLESEEYGKLTDTGGRPRWLGDNRTLVYNAAGAPLPAAVTVCSGGS